MRSSRPCTARERPHGRPSCSGFGSVAALCPDDVLGLRLSGPRQPDEHGGAHARPARVSDVPVDEGTNARLRCTRCGARGEERHVAVDAMAR
jgi:hypothetical protein